MLRNERKQRFRDKIIYQEYHKAYQINNDRTAENVSGQESGVFAYISFDTAVFKQIYMNKIRREGSGRELVYHLAAAELHIGENKENDHGFGYNERVVIIPCGGVIYHVAGDDLLQISPAEYCRDIEYKQQRKLSGAGFLSLFFTVAKLAAEKIHKHEIYYRVARLRSANPNRT